MTGKPNFVSKRRMVQGGILAAAVAGTMTLGAGLASASTSPNIPFGASDEDIEIDLGIDIELPILGDIEIGGGGSADLPLN